MVRHQLFTLVTLLGCVVPWITPRHFPVHRLQGAREPIVISLANPEDGQRESPPPADIQEVGQRQLAGQLEDHSAPERR